MDEIALTKKPEEAGALVADIEAAAMSQAYQRRSAQNTNLFVQRHCTDVPDQIGRAVSDIQAKAKRDALLGFLWRWGLIGGCGSFATGLLVAEGAVIAVVLVVSVPIALGLSLYK